MPWGELFLEKSFVGENSAGLQELWPDLQRGLNEMGCLSYNTRNKQIHRRHNQQLELFRAGLGLCAGERVCERAWKRGPAATARRVWNSIKPPHYYLETAKNMHFAPHTECFAIIPTTLKHFRHRTSKIAESLTLAVSGSTFRCAVILLCVKIPIPRRLRANNVFIRT